MPRYPRLLTWRNPRYICKRFPAFPVTRARDELEPVMPDLQTTNLGVGSSSLSGRANFSLHWRQSRDAERALERCSAAFGGDAWQGQ